MPRSIKDESRKKPVPRRDFLIGGGTAIAAGALTVCAPETVRAAASSANISYDQSKGYLVYDSRLCLGCQSCMFACSMTHEGVAAPSLSLIQIIRDAPAFTKYPYDITMSICRQCVTPVCVQNCPTGACHVDADNGNVRRIDQDKCIGCKRCLDACPLKPHRTVWNPVKNRAAKCDLCIDTPFRDHAGGPDGRQACVDVCPAGALALVKKAPSQKDVRGYDVNLATAQQKEAAPFILDVLSEPSQE
jgi:protein NrfC